MARDPQPSMDMQVGRAQWQPHQQIFPYTSPYTTWPYPARAPKRDTYANRVQVERGEHDAVIRFYRDKGKSGAMVKEITVPLSVLDALVADHG
jgi:hypothetical protein